MGKIAEFLKKSHLPKFLLCLHEGSSASVADFSANSSRKGREYMKKAGILAIAIMVSILFAGGAGAIPQKINYQGKLTDSGGNPVSGSKTMVFSIYDAESGGGLLWNETRTVPVNMGMYSVVLGETSAISLEVFNGEERWLGIKVESDSEMTPRLKIVSVGNAYKAYDADNLGGHPAGYFLPSTEADYVSKSGDTMTGPLTAEAAISGSLESRFGDAARYWKFELIDLTDLGVGYYPMLSAYSDGAAGNIGAIKNNFIIAGFSGAKPTVTLFDDVGNTSVSFDYDASNGWFDFNNDVYFSNPTVHNSWISLEGNCSIKLHGGSIITQSWDGSGNDITLYSRTGTGSYLKAANGNWSIHNVNNPMYIDSNESTLGDALLNIRSGTPGIGGDTYNRLSVRIGRYYFGDESDSDIDLEFYFRGNTNTGQLNWMEDEDRFQIEDDVLVNGKTLTANDLKLTEAGNGPNNTFVSAEGSGGLGWYQFPYSSGDWLVYSTDRTEDNGNDLNIALDPSDGHYFGYGRGASDPIYLDNAGNYYIEGDGDIVFRNASIQDVTATGNTSLGNASGDITTINDILILTPRATAPYTSSTPEGTCWMDSSSNKLRVYLNSSWNDCW